MVDYLSKRFALEAKIQSLTCFPIEIEDQQRESLTFEKNLQRAKVSVDPHTKIIDGAAAVERTVTELLDHNLDIDDKKTIEEFLKFIKLLEKKHQKRKEEVQTSNERIELISKVINEVEEQHSHTITEDHKRHAQFVENANAVVDIIAALIAEYRTLPEYSPTLKHTVIDTNHNAVNTYEFITKLKVAEIGPEYFLELIKRPLKADAKIDWSTVTEAKLAEDMKNFESETNVLQHFQNKVLEAIDHDFEHSCAIIVQGNDRYQEMSAGFDAQVYFDLLSWERRRHGIYIIDQPEDNISQRAIREYLLNRFKAMGSLRQVIMVTHNPQFIVNLDIDNLIYLSMVDDHLNVQSGALEYKDEQTDILKIVADTIDGGLESIQKRWKRYDKASDL